MVRIDLFGTSFFFFFSFSWRNNKQYIVRGVVYVLLRQCLPCFHASWLSCLGTKSAMLLTLCCESQLASALSILPTYGAVVCTGQRATLAAVQSSSDPIW